MEQQSLRGLGNDNESCRGWVVLEQSSEWHTGGYARTKFQKI